MPRISAPIKEYLAALAGVAGLTLACWSLIPAIGYSAISLIYLLGVLLAGMLLGRGPVLLVAALSAVCWNWLFIPPVFNFHIHKLQDALMLVTYFIVALTIGSLTSRLRAREQVERDREQRATALYHFVQKLAAEPSVDCALATATAHIRELLQIKASIVLDAHPPGMANANIPIKRFDATFGGLRIEPREGIALSASQHQLLEAFADHLASLIERDRLLQIAAQAKLSVEAERLRKALLDCVSHELKTPIAAIGAASQELLRDDAKRDPELARQLAREIEHGSRRLHRVVNHLLDMTRLESGVIRPKLEWCDIPELLQSAIEAEQETIGDRAIVLDVAEELPLALVDYSLLEQALGKLLANAVSYTPANSPVELSVTCVNDELAISVADRGLGLPAAAPERIFNKFDRGDETRTGGLGLGLSIARGFVEAHGGRLTATNRAGGGALFSIRVPVQTRDGRTLETIL